MMFCFFFFFQAEDGIRDAQESRGLGDVYKRQGINAEYGEPAKVYGDAAVVMVSAGMSSRRHAGSSPFIRRNHGYPNLANTIGNLKNVKSSGYGLMRPPRSAQVFTGPPRRDKLPPRSLSQQADSLPSQGGRLRRVSKGSQEPTSPVLAKEPKEFDMQPGFDDMEEAGEDNPAELQPDPVHPAEALSCLAGSSGLVGPPGVRRGKIVFQPCLETPNMTVCPGAQHTPGLSYHMDFSCRVLEFLLGMHGFKRTKKDPNWSVWWTSGSTVRASMLQSLLPHQKVNHFPRSSEISRKDRMTENIYRMQQQHGHKSFDLVGFG
eukprot:TRINITY_DN11653_c0_g1_i4.p1 TRINITY_DN11653_c0_g1~~TRINITY_DN11653_c0_g1_i4.p1  ORF type:complete len:319 (+),score=68.67 TRINITY_DN11653_c0_g1_i4:118-1074(+)